MRDIVIFTALVVLAFVLLCMVGFPAHTVRASSGYYVELGGAPTWRLVSAAERTAAAEERQAKALERIAERLDQNTFVKVFPNGTGAYFKVTQ